MKVRCVKQINSYGAPIESSSWLTTGNVYHVLEIYIERGSIDFRILGDEKFTPALHPAGQFELVSGKIPSCWETKFLSNSFVLGPREWLEIGFWERFFDGEAEARKIFNGIYQAILAEDP